MSGIPSWARVGAKVVCVQLPENKNTNLVLRRVYTIKSIAPYRDIDGHAGLELVEVKPVVHPRYFRAQLFRPLITRTQEEDVALFAPLLQSKRIEERV